MIQTTIYAAVMVMGVIDGDTFKARIETWPGQHVEATVRIAGIDAPELRGACAVEKSLANSAKVRLATLLADGQVLLLDVKPDKYAGRVDAVVAVEGRSIGEVLVSEGHARTYSGGPRRGWCP